MWVKSLGGISWFSFSRIFFILCSVSIGGFNGLSDILGCEDFMEVFQWWKEIGKFRPEQNWKCNVCDIMKQTTLFYYYEFECLFTYNNFEWHVNIFLIKNYF